MKILDNFKNQFTNHVAETILTAIIILIISLYFKIIEFLGGFSSTALSNLIFGLIILFLILCFVSLFLYSKLRKKFIPKCGVLWDRNKEPYCPSCKTLLAFVDIYSPSIYEATCSGCDKRLRLIDDEGKYISMREAKRLIDRKSSDDPGIIEPKPQ